MKKMKIVKVTLVAALCVFFSAVMIFESCHNASKATVVTTIIIPKDFPKSINFPVDSSTIYNWLTTYDTPSITKHAWDLWAGLTTNSGELLDGDSLLIFETWLGVKELSQFCAAQNGKGNLLKEKRERTQLSIPRQFVHGQLMEGKVVDTSKGFNIFETVAYNNPAAFFATSNLIFRQSVLKSFWKKGAIGTIPSFPHDAITTKPTYYAGKADKDGLIRVPTWKGIPSDPKVYPPSDWGSYVYVDIHNKQNPNRVPVPITSDGATPAQKDSATINVNDFIHFKINATMAAYLNKHQDNGNNQFVAGDFVLLVGMHVGTKEINNWTWQTFFWTPDPKNPLFPASVFTAGLMPATVVGAARHYAVATAYAMVWPNQKINGGHNDSVQGIIAFNPYLEAGLTGLGQGLPNKMNPAYKYGVQTNCMSCHALAAQNFDTHGAFYTTDQYIDIGATAIFNNMVQLDFAWSIQGNVDTAK
jgi:hypothetical protein